MQNKEQTRQILLSKRATITFDQRDQAAKFAAELLQNSTLFSSSQHIACYFPQEKEFNCIPIMEMIWQAKKTCYLPILSTVKNNSLEFALYHSGDSLQCNRFKILEPTRTERFAAENLDLVIVPLVGFDHQGRRLGMGGGYYDRTFQFLKQHALQKPFLLGLAFEVQQASFSVDSWDVCLHGVLTEEKLVDFTVSSSKIKNMSSSVDEDDMT